MPDITCVIQYGMCKDIPNLVQRGGLGGHSTSTFAIFLILYEPWAMTLDLTLSTHDLDDPDQPLQAITKTSKKPERTGMAMYQLIQSPSCIRQFLASYLSDGTSTGMH